MSKDLVPRVSGDGPRLDTVPEGDAREKAERAAARISSIHRRWAPPIGVPPAGHELVAKTAEDVEAAFDAVRVTLIVGIVPAGIAGAAEAPAARPRFKTLLGVPRASPELDALAGLARSPSPWPMAESSAQRAPEREGRPEPMALPSAGCTESDASSRAWRQPTLVSDKSDSAAGRLGEWTAMLDRPLDESAEVAALRPSSRGKLWLLRLAAVAMGGGVLAWGATPEASSFARWLRDDAGALPPPESRAASGHPSRPLRPELLVEPLTPGAPSTLPPRAAGPPEPLVPRATPSALTHDAPMPDRSPRSAGAAARFASPAVSRSGHLPSPSRTAARRNSRSQSTARAGEPRRRELAAARKRSAPATAPERRKVRSRQQKPPRRSAGDGIIRQTPF